MKIIYGIQKLKPFVNAVVAVGVFDGVHIGHRLILRDAVLKARAIKGKALLVTFWPHPQKEDSLLSLKHRLNLIREIGIDCVIVLPFDKRFARMTAGDFIRRILVKKIAARFIYVGENFRFGKGALGDTKLLKTFAGKCGFSLKVYKVIRRGGRAVSSTYIRSLIKRGFLRKAERLLGRPVGVLGTVVKGRGFAGRHGFSTANIDPHHEVLPAPGIYSCRVRHKNKPYYGICYIGSGRTVFKDSSVRVEAHMFNFKKNIYGDELSVSFIEKIRPDKKFSTVLALIKQIKKDIYLVKKRFFLL